MGLARDSSPDASQASGAARLPLPARVWLRLLSSSEPRVSFGSRRDPPRSRDTIPASSPPSMASPPASIPKPATCHTFRHYFATHLPESGSDILAVQEHLGHRDITTPRISTPVRTRGGLGARSPGDILEVLPGGIGRNHLYSHPRWWRMVTAEHGRRRANGLWGR